MTEPHDSALIGAFAALRTHRLAWAALAAVFCLWFLTLDMRHLLRSDEGRYAEIAREMLASGDWVTIRYNGLKYFEKPPFHFWMTALAYRLFGIGEWQARLWVAASGAAGLGVTMLAARRWFGTRVGLLSGLVLLATPAWNLASHFNSLDMSVSGALAVVLGALLIAQHPQSSPSTRRNWMLVAWAAAAIAVLTKGLIGIVLPGLVLIVYTAIAQGRGLWQRLRLVSGALLMLVIVAPWFVLVSLRNPEFAHFFFVHEHFQRFASGIDQRDAPYWYFVPQFAMGFLPWLGLAWGMGIVVRDEPRRQDFRPLLLLAVWAATIFLFFSASRSKLPGYIVPIYPALAVLAAVWLARIDARAWARQLIAITIVVTVALLAIPLIDRLGPEATHQPSFRTFSAWIGIACILALAGLAWAWRLNRNGRQLPSVVVYSLALFLSTTVGLLGHEALGRGISGVDLVPAVRSVLTPDMPIYSVRLLDHTLPFYLRRTTIMVEGADELEFGTRQEPQKWIPTLDAFREVWISGGPALALMSPQTYAALARDDLPMFRVAGDARRVVVANFPPRSP